MTEKFSSKLGTTRAGERTRVWLEGRRLINAGFLPGALFSKRWGEGKLTLSLVDPETFDTLGREERGRVSGKGEKPIIDITGVRVSETFTGSHVAVSYGVRITITNGGE
jgi:hypothetical protein